MIEARRDSIAALPSRNLLGVRVTDASTDEAVSLMSEWVARRRRTRAVFIVNAAKLMLVRSR